MATDMIMPYEPTWYRYTYTGSLDILPESTIVYKVERAPIASEDILRFIKNINFT